MLSPSPERLLAEIDDIIRVMPPLAALRPDTPENLSWLARASAAMHLWDIGRSIEFSRYIEQVRGSSNGDIYMRGMRGMLMTLHQASHELRIKTVGPLSVAVDQGRPFEYFDEIRKIIEAAKDDLFFVDPYLDAEFASRYLLQVSAGVSIRLLARERIATLLPAIKLVRQQQSLKIEVRSSAAFHDRYLFVDRQACYHSGASFKDGAKNTPTTLTQIVDAFAVVSDTYENLWAAATVHP